MSQDTMRAKRVSNYELFFDLALVLAISRLNSAIHLNEVGWWQILFFIFTNIVLLTIWINEVFYYEKYGDSRRDDIFSVIALMFVLGNLALNFNMEPSMLLENPGGVKVFHALLMVSYGIIALQYYLKGRLLGFNHDMKINMGLMGIYMLSVLPFVLGWQPSNFWFLGIYLLPIVLPRFANHYCYKGQPTKTNFPHALERSQLMTILTFGEAVIAIIITYPMTTTLYQGALLFFGMASLFMFYMAQTFLAIDHHKPANVASLFYFHIFIFIGVNFFTVGVEFLADHHHAQTGLFMFLAGILLFFIGTLMTTIYNQDIYRLRPKDYSLMAVFLALFGLGGLWIGPHILPLSLLLIVLTWSINHFYMILRKNARNRHKVPHPDPKMNLRDFS